MKIAAVYVVTTIAAVVAPSVVQWVDHLSTWLELAIKVGGALAAVGGAVKWLIGPGYRFVRRWVLWVRAHLELLAEMDMRLDRIEGRLDDGETHFQRLDDSLGVMTSDEARAVRRAISTGNPVTLTDAGNVERREPPM